MAGSIVNTPGLVGPYSVTLLCIGPLSRSYHSVDTSHVFGHLHYFICKFTHNLYSRIMLFLVNMLSLVMRNLIHSRSCDVT